MAGARNRVVEDDVHYTAEAGEPAAKGTVKPKPKVVKAKVGKKGKAK